ncbi:unnamed protein product, partial [Didymodactylos carnosus]
SFNEHQQMADDILKLFQNLINTETTDDFLFDQIHSQFTFSALIISCLASTILQVFVDPIECVQPAQFTGGYTSFAHTLCWLNNTYYYPQTGKQIPIDTTERQKHRLHYYQWLPFIFLFQAFFFMVPRLIWLSFNNRNGLNPSSLVLQGRKYDKNAKISNFISKEIERYLMCRRLAQYKRKLQYRYSEYLTSKGDEQREDDLSTIETFLPKVSLVTRSRNAYLVTLYLFIKILYILNIILQTFLLDRLLSTGKYGFIRFGYDMIKYLFHYKRYTYKTILSYKQLFPFLTLCDFNVRELGQDHSYTIEIPYTLHSGHAGGHLEKNRNIINFIYTIYNYLIIFGRYSYVKKILRLAIAKQQTSLLSFESKDNAEDDNDPTTDIDLISDVYSNKQRLRNFVHWLQPDGVFLLHLLNSHVNELVVISSLGELVEIWAKKYENPTNLAQHLMKNDFSYL